VKRRVKKFARVLAPSRKRFFPPNNANRVRDLAANGRLSEPTSAEVPW